jgi:hypothetical protein
VWIPISLKSQNEDKCRAFMPRVKAKYFGYFCPKAGTTPVSCAGQLP